MSITYLYTDNFETIEPRTDTLNICWQKLTYDKQKQKQEAGKRN